MNKKAISPLIASVLLIGFTVALAAVVMTWGGGFVRKTTEQTGETAEKTIMCANLNLEITGFNCGDKKVTISNSKDIKIIKTTFRKLDKDGNLIGTPITKTDEIGAYGIKIFEGIIDTGVYKIQVIPELEGGIICSDPPLEKVVNCAAT